MSAHCESMRMEAPAFGPRGGRSPKNVVLIKCKCGWDTGLHHGDDAAEAELRAHAERVAS